MRRFGFTLAALLLMGVQAGAQQAPATAPAAPAAPAADPVLDGHLQKWEQAMKDITGLAAQLVRVDKDRIIDNVEKLTGEAYYMKAGTGPTALNLALLELRPEGKREFKEKYLCTGTFLYHYLPAQKEIRFYKLPEPKPGQVAEDSLLSLLFGMKAAEAKNRYDLKLAKEDQYYIYVDIAPRSPADRSDFRRARMVLSKTNYLPRQLWFEQGNGNEVTWDIPTLRTDVKLDRRAFDTPKPPEGWKLVPGEETRKKPVIRPAAPSGR